MRETTRREALLLPASAALTAACDSGGRDLDASRAGDDLRRYVDLGIKAAGGSGDNACGAWLESRLRQAGFATDRQAFDVPYFEAETAILSIVSATASVIPQAIVSQTGAAGISAPLRLRTNSLSQNCAGAIALIILDHRRWSSLSSPQIEAQLNAAFEEGALAAVLITSGPTGEAIALNAPSSPRYDRPICILAPKDSALFIDAARNGVSGTLTIRGDGGRRKAFNVVGRIDRGAAQTLVLSTPRSGWFLCAGERGPGVAVWLALCETVSRAMRHNVVVVATSGHEYDNAGGEAFLAHKAPAPETCAAWIHLGANLAARDWHDLGSELLPMVSPDPQRYLVTSEPFIEAAKRSFKGLSGLENVYPASAGAAGELKGVLLSGYNAAGVFGAHRFHHVGTDDLRCVDQQFLSALFQSFKKLILAIL